MLPALITVFYPHTDAEGVTLRDAYADAAKMLCDPSYRLLHFVIMLRRAQFKGDHGRGIGALTRLILRPLRRLMVFVASDMETQELLRETAKHIGIQQEAPPSVLLSVLCTRRIDPVLRPIAVKLIRITWRHGLSDLWKILKPPKPTHAMLPSPEADNRVR